MASEKQTVADAPQTIDVDPGAIVERLDLWVDGFIRLLPNIGVALLVIVLGVLIASITRRIIRGRADQQGRENLGELLASFTRWTIIVFTIMAASTIVFPSISPGDLIASLGVGSVAIGFAFKDILQNWLAGLLILVRQPFEIGDQIEAGDYVGTVEHISSRATLIKTFDGQRAVIPNSEIYTNAVLVKTAHSLRRTQYDVGIGYADDIDEATEILQRAVAKVEGIEKDKNVDVFVWDLAASWVTLRVRWWTDTQRADVVATRSAVIRAIKLALDDARIDMPYETQVQLFHDQTETGDGDRKAQREGWPADNDDGTQPRWRAQRDVEKAVSAG